MKSKNEYYLDKVESSLEELGIDTEVVDLAGDYLDGIVDKDVYLSKLPKINFVAKNQVDLHKTIEAYDSLKKSESNDYYVKYIDILFQIGESTVGYMIAMKDYYITGNAMEKMVERGVEEYKAAAMFTEGFVWTANLLHWNQIQYLYTLGKKEIHILEDAIDSCKCDNDNALTVLVSVYFNILIEEQKITTLDAKEVKRMEYLEDSVIGSIINMTVSKPSEEDMDIIRQFINSDEDGTKELSEEVIKIINNKTRSSYLVRLLTGCCFFAYRLSYKLRSFMKIMAFMDADTALSAIYEFPPFKLFKADSLYLDRLLMISMDCYLVWAINMRLSNIKTILLHKLEVSREDFLKAARKANVKECTVMLQLLRDSGSDENLSIINEYKRVLQKKLVDYYVESYSDTSSTYIKNYIIGIDSLSELLLNVGTILNEHLCNYYYTVDFIKSYLDLMGKDEFIERVIIYLAIIKNTTVFTDCLFKFNNETSLYEEDSIMDIFDIFDKHQLPVGEQIKFIETLFDIYSTRYKVALNIQALIPIKRMLTTRKEEVVACIPEVGAMARSILLNTLFRHGNNDFDILLRNFNDVSRLVKETIVNIFSEHEEQSDAIIEKLKSKKQNEREKAILIIENWNKDTYNEALKSALKVEKSKKNIALLQKYFNITPAEAIAQNGMSVDELVKLLTKGNRRTSLAWAYASPFIPVAFKEARDGKEFADDDFMKAVLLSYSGMEKLGLNLEVRLLTDLLNKQDLEIFINEVFDRWLNEGAESKKKWILYVGSVYGGLNIIQKFNHNINEWPKRNRGSIACEAVKALAINGSPMALLTVDGISRKFKYRQIKTAAANALEYAASQLGLTTEELSDKIVPNLGFDEHMMRIFDYGERKFKVYITSNLELEVFDESDKKLKSLPAPGKRDNEEKAKAASVEFKQMKKQLKTTVSTQKMRLELALSTNRSWKPEAWKALFVANPIMHQFAISLVWGVYEEDQLLSTFRYMEDGTFNTEEEDEFQFPEKGIIGLVHPIELSEESLEAWKQQLEDYEIKQSLDQLDRKVYRITEEECNMKYLDRFGGYVVNGLFLISKLIANGWYRGSVLDGGGYYNIYREDTGSEIGVLLELSGLSIGMENEDTVVYIARFYKSNSVERGSYIYDTIEDERSYYLRNVPKKYFSETVYQLEKAFASSSTRKEGWREEAFPKKK